MAEWIGGELVYQYSLTAAEGLKQKKLLNLEIAGVTVEGKVVKVERDTIKVWLDEFVIDKAENPGASDLWPFVYASFYTAGEKNGWYCMPEEGDRVKVYFPTSNEENAFAMGSIRETKKGAYVRIGKPNIKYFRTKFEKVLVMGEEEIILTCFGKNREKVELRFNDGSNSSNQGLISISSYGKIGIKAGGNIALHSGNSLEITADSLLSVRCKESLLKLNGETRVFGNPSKYN
jgi:hypothetical protein